MRIGERRLSVDDVDLVPPELVVDHLLLSREDVLEGREQSIGGGPCLEGAEKLPFQPPALSRQRQHRLAERFARDRATDETGAADASIFLDHRDALAELRGLDRCPLAGGAAPDAGEVVRCGGGHRLTHMCAPPSWRVFWCGVQCAVKRL